MKALIVGVAAVLGVILLAGILHVSVSGHATLNPACCAASVWKQSPSGYFQADSVVEDVYCNGNLQLCCIEKMSKELQAPVRIDGAHYGKCGSQNPFK